MPTQAELTNPFGTPPQEQEPPRQGPLGYAWDTAINLGQGAVGVGESAAAAAGNAPATDLLADIAYHMGRAKTARGQYVERHPEQNQGGVVDAITQAVVGIAPYIPVAIGAEAVGAAAAPVTGGASTIAAPAAAFGALTYGSMRAKLRDAIRFMPEDQLWQSSKYQQYRGEGLSDSEARDRLWADSNEITPALIAGGAGAIGGGIATKIFGRLGSEAAADAITQRLLTRMGIGAAEAYGAGVAQIGGEDYATQMAKRQAGIGPTEDIGAAIQTGAAEALPFAALGALGGLARRSKPKPADQIGADTMPVIASQLSESIRHPPNRIGEQLITEVDPFINRQPVGRPAPPNRTGEQPFTPEAPLAPEAPFAPARAPGVGEQPFTPEAPLAPEAPARPAERPGVGEQPFAGEEPLQPEAPFIKVAEGREPTIPEKLQTEYGTSTAGQPAPRVPRRVIRPEEIYLRDSLELLALRRDERNQLGEDIARRQNALDEQARQESGLTDHDELDDYIAENDHLKQEHDAIQKDINRWDKLDKEVSDIRQAVIARRNPKAIERVRAVAEAKAERERTAKTGKQVVAELAAPRVEPEERALPPAENENKPLRIRGTLQGTTAQKLATIEKAVPRTVQQEVTNLGTKQPGKRAYVYKGRGSNLTPRTREALRGAAPVRAEPVSEAMRRIHKVATERERERAAIAKRIEETITSFKEKAKAREEVRNIRRAMWEKVAAKQETRAEETGAARKEVQAQEDRADIELLSRNAARHPEHIISAGQMDELMKGDVRDAARAFIESAKARVKAANAALRNWVEQRTEAGRKPVIRYGFAKRSGVEGSWRNVIVEYNKFIRNAEKALEKGNAGKAWLSDLLNEHYERERFVGAGDIVGLERRRRSELEALRAMFKAADADMSLTDEEHRRITEANDRLEAAMDELDLSEIQAAQEGVISEQSRAEARMEQEAREAARPLQSQFARSGRMGIIPRRVSEGALDVFDMAHSLLNELIGPVRNKKEREARIELIKDALAQRRKQIEIDRERYWAQRSEKEREEAAKKEQEAQENMPKTDLQVWGDRFYEQAYRHTYLAENSEEAAQRAGEKARTEFYTLKPEDRALLLSYENNHDTSMMDGMTIQQKIGFMKKVREGLEERAKSKLSPEEYVAKFMADEGQMLMERAQRLYEAVDLVRPDFETQLKDKDVRKLYNDLAYKLGAPSIREPTVENVKDLYGRASAELERIETMMRARWETLKAAGALPDYGIKGLLDPNVDLRAEGALPMGAHVSKVSDHFGPDSSTYGLSAGLSGARAPLVRHFMQVATKVAGKVDVVEVTGEHMPQLAVERGLPPEVNAFYDPMSDRIFITREAMQSPDRGKLLVHEVAHALTESAAQRYPAIVQRFEEIRRALKNVFNNPVQKAHEEVRAQLEGNDYALQNVHEFISEFWVNDKLALALDAVETPAQQRLRWKTQERASLLGRMVQAVKAALLKAFGLGSHKMMLNDATVAALDMLQRFEERGRVRPWVTDESIARPAPSAAGIVRDVMRETREGTTELGRETWDRLTKAGGLAGLNKYGFFRQTAEAVHRYDPQLAEKIHKIIDILGETATKQQDIAREIDQPLLTKLMETVQKGKPDLVNDKLVDYVYNENYAGVVGGDPLFKGENAYLDPNDPMHQQAIERHPKLAQEWAELSPEQQATIKYLRDTLKGRHEGVLRAHLQQLVETARSKNEPLLEKFTPGAVDAVMKKIRNQPLTPEDQAALKADLRLMHESDLDEIIKERRWNRIPAFRKLDAPFYPMIREGDWLVHGRYDLEKIAKDAGLNFANTEETEGGRGLRFEFLDAADRQKFVKWLSTHEKYDFKVTSAGKTSATVNVEHFSGHDTRRAAERTLEKLRQDPSFVRSDVTVRRDAFTKFGSAMDQLAGINRLIEGLQNSPGFRGMQDQEKLKFENELRELGLRYLLSESARSKYLPRRYTRGASEDLLGNVRKYMHNTSYTMADLQNRGKMLRAVEEFDKDIQDRRYQKDNDEFGIARSQVHREVHERLAMRPEEHSSGWLDKTVNALVRLTSLAKLGSPSFHIMNATEPWALAGPMMSGDHGPRAYNELRRAYAVFGGNLFRNMKQDVMAVLKQGIDGAPNLTDHVKSLADRAANQPDAAELKDLLDFLHRTQYLNRDAGFDISRHYDPQASTISKLMDWVDSFQRAIGAAVESQNRATTAIAAYRLAREKMNPEEARRYAQRMVEKSAGLYAWYNKPTIMNSANPVYRMAAQFRNYALRVTQNYALMTLGAYKALTRADADNPAMHARNVALARQLLMQTASQALASGLFGTFYWGPIGSAVNASGLITGFNAEDAEHVVRAGLADVVGPMWAEFIMRGGLRTLGSGFGGGLGERISHSSLWTYGALGQKPDDWYRAVGNFVLGASGSTAFDAADGLRGLYQGLSNYAEGHTSQGTEQIVQGMRKLVPVKVAADALGVTHDTMWGKTTPSGQPRQPPLDEAAKLSNLLGFRTGEQVERSEQTGAFIRDRQRYYDAITNLKDAYAKASRPGERSAIIQQLRLFNEGLPRGMQLTVGDLVQYAHQYEKKSEIPGTQMGLTVNRRTRPLLQQIQSTYNLPS